MVILMGDKEEIRINLYKLVIFAPLAPSSFHGRSGG